MSAPLLRSTFALPVGIALLSLFGLIVALTGDGLRDIASGVALAVPVLAVPWAMVRRRPSRIG